MTGRVEGAGADVAGAFTISWLRAYACSFEPHQLEPLAAGSRLASGRIDPDPAFFDIQTLALGQVARAKLAGLRLLSPCDTDVRVHLLVHGAGFCLLRMTLHSGDFREPGAMTLTDFHRYHQALWDDGQPARWEFPDDGETRSFGVRQAMDWVFFDLHERFFRRPPTTDRLAQMAAGAWDEHARLARTHELAHDYPVTFGTHYELSVSPSGVYDSAWALRFMCGGDADDLACAEVDRAEGRHAWYLSENKSLLLLGRSDPGPSELDALEDMRMQLVEYMTLRRAALRMVQRDTQAVVARGARPSTRQLTRWSTALTSLTDDYTLHDRVGHYLGPAKARLREDERLRDLGELELQVRANVDAFNAEHQLATVRAQTFLGAAFGVVAGLGVADLVADVPGLDPTALGETALRVGFLVLGITLAVVVLGRLGRRTHGMPVRRRTRRTLQRVRAR